MDDPILPEESQPNATPKPVEAPAPVPAPAPAGPDRLDRLEAAMSELTRTVAEAAQRLTQSPAPLPKAPEEFLNELASNPQETIRRVANETFQAAAAQTLTPAVMQVLDTASQQLLSAHQSRVDFEFGEGTFDEVFRPQLERDLAQLKTVNPRAIADPATLEALVNRMYGGDNFEKLVERRKVATREGRSHTLPSGGVPRLRGPRGTEEELPADVEQFLRDVERSTGEQIDRKSYAKLYHTGVETGPGRHRTTVLDYLKAVGAKADTLKAYGGERGSS